MNDTKLHEQILGLQPPWSVQSVTLKKAEGVIEIEVVCGDGAFCQGVNCGFIFLGPVLHLDIRASIPPILLPRGVATL